MLSKSLRSPLVEVVVISSLVGCAFSEPPNGTLKCGAGGQACPDGYSCSAYTGTCWKEGTEPKHDAAGADDLGAATDATAREPVVRLPTDGQPSLDAPPDLPRFDTPPSPHGSGGGTGAGTSTLDGQGGVSGKPGSGGAAGADTSHPGGLGGTSSKTGTGGAAGAESSQPGGLGGTSSNTGTGGTAGSATSQSGGQGGTSIKPGTGGAASGGTSAAGGQGGAGGTTVPDAGSFRTFTCEPSCYNQVCSARTGMCTTDYGRCGSVPCKTDADCCNLAECDNVAQRCSQNQSKYFTCEGGQCVRAEDGYAGVCTTVNVQPNDCQELCPQSAPTAGTRCSVYSEQCSYGSRTCECAYINKQFVWACYQNYTCESTCFNQSCAGATDMCTDEFGRCNPIPCSDDADCCALAKCDNLTDRCSKQRSRYFTCTSGQCIRTEEGFEGYCKDIEALLPDEATCADLCPPAKPEHNTRCQSYSKSCTYGTTVCRCQYGTQGILWTCL